MVKAVDWKVEELLVLSNWEGSILWGKTKSLSDILKEILNKSVDVIKLHRLMKELKNSEAWKTFEEFRDKNEVKETEEYLKKLGKVRVEFLVLDENGVVKKRSYFRQPVSLVKYEDVECDFRTVINDFERLKKKQPWLKMDINMFEYSKDEEPLVDRAVQIYNLV